MNTRETLFEAIEYYSTTGCGGVDAGCKKEDGFSSFIIFEL